MSLRGCLIIVFIQLVVISAMSADTGRNRHKRKGKHGKEPDETYFLLTAGQQKNERLFVTAEDRSDDVVVEHDRSNDPILSKIKKVPTPSRVCPWKYVVVTNPHRIPNSTLEVRCTQNECQALPSVFKHITESQSSRTKKRSNSGTTPQCEAVYYYRWVKVKQVKNGKRSRSYVKRILPVAVACSCMQAPLVKSN